MGEGAASLTDDGVEMGSDVWVGTGALVGIGVDVFVWSGASTAVGVAGAAVMGKVAVGVGSDSGEDRICVTSATQMHRTRKAIPNAITRSSLARCWVCSSRYSRIRILCSDNAG